MKRKYKKNDSLWWVYMIRTRLNAIYTGISTDVDRRFVEHSSGDPKGARNLKGKGPLTLLFKKKIGNKSEASKVEWTIKQLTKLKKENIVSGKLNWKSFLKDINVKGKS